MFYIKLKYIENAQYKQAQKITPGLVECGKTSGKQLAVGTLNPEKTPRQMAKKMPALMGGCSAAGSDIETLPPACLQNRADSCLPD